jgi:lysyl-tRNA synthetase class 1
MWAHDFLAKHQAKKHIINDSKTPSGPVHIGSFRSFIIHDVLKRVLNESNHQATYLYGFDDYDPMDDVPRGHERLSEHLGKPLVNVPSSDPLFKSLADEVERNYRQFHSIVGVHPTEYYRTSILYKEGRFNKQIRKVLDNASIIRRIYSDISGSKRNKNWLPVQPICPQCHKIGTTYAFHWDGQMVKFECQEDLVSWTKGCGYSGEISPFDGNAKMHWRVEWAAKWDLFKVTIEWAGKDHASKGGSFDTSRAILEEVFGRKEIALEGHEFFLKDGQKMSSSKGNVVLPEEALEVFDPSVFRFLFVRTRPQQALEIDLTKITPATYDEYDRCQMSYLEKTNQDQADFFYYSQINPQKIDGQIHNRFSSIVNLIQLPSLKDELEKPEVKKRIPFATTWLKKYAPEEARFDIKESLPDAVKNLSPEQKAYLKQVVGLIDAHQEEDLQASLYELSKKLRITPTDAFAAIYISLIGKSHGPRAGMLLSSQPVEFVKSRLLEAATC